MHDPDQVELIQHIIQERTQAATTDREALAIVVALLQEVEQGLTFDEEGNPVRLVGEEDWSAAQIQADATFANGIDDTKKKREAYTAFALLGLAIVVAIVGLLTRNREEAALPLTTAIPDVVERPDTLTIADELGGRITLGQPRTLEIATDGGSTTMAVVVAPVGEDGILPIADALHDGELVAEWIFGTVVNFSFGIPNQVHADIPPGGRAIIRTTTGATYPFTCNAADSVAPQEVEIFSQNRPGLTLFPLPASQAPVPVIWCAYDPTLETVTEGAVSLGQSVTVAAVTLTVDTVDTHQLIDGQLAFNVRGRIQGSGSVILGLDATVGKYAPLGEQFLAQATEALWLAEFILPPAVFNEAVYLEIRSPSGGRGRVALGRVASPRDGVQVAVNGVTWADQTGEIEVVATVSGENTALITAADFQALQGGVDVPLRPITPLVPFLVDAERELTLRLTPVPGAGAVTIQIVDTLWTIQGVP